MDFFIRAQAPFSAYRYFQTGAYRATAPVIPPSAAFGLLLNLANIEMRDTMIGTAITKIRQDVPCLELAVGAVNQGEISTLYQQLHIYPVNPNDATVKQAEGRTKGQKALAKMARREILVNLDCMIAIRNPDHVLIDRIQRGLAGEFNGERYGLPFAGDNSFLFNDINIFDKPPEETYWYVQTKSDEQINSGSCRLTVSIDRTESSKTTSLLYAPESQKRTYPPDNAWTWTPKKPEL
ncbi:CRISPR-associated protein DevS (plasmid) [Cylindrospermum sp. NIES-4074]|nr:CRISPR-associated protein DevS [Cylindrospermum sp. NIES-4074]